jgi:hypothetical protein
MFAVSRSKPMGTPFSDAKCGSRPHVHQKVPLANVRPPDGTCAIAACARVAYPS